MFDLSSDRQLMVYVKPRRGPRRVKFTKAGPVTVTRADGTVEEKKPYNPWQQAKIVGAGNRRRMPGDPRER